MTAQRQTKQLQAIRNAFETAGRPLSIDEIHDLASKTIKSLGIRTVYRAVRRLQENGDLCVVNVPVEAIDMNWRVSPPRTTTTFIAPPAIDSSISMAAQAA